MLCHQGPLGTLCLQQYSDHMCLWPGYHLHYDTPKHDYSGVLKELTGEWNGALLSSVTRLGSECVWVMDIFLHGLDLVSINFRSAFTHDTQAHLRYHCVGAINYNSRSHLVFLQGKSNSARHIEQVVNPVLLSFIRKKVDVLFQQDNARPHTAAATQRRPTLRGVQNVPRPARSPISRQLNTHSTWWNGTLLFLQSLPQPLPNCDNSWKILANIYRRMTFSAFMTVYMREYTPALPPEGAALYIVVTVWAPLLRNVWSTWSKFVIIYSYNDKLSATSILNTRNLSLKICIFVR